MKNQDKWKLRFSYENGILMPRCDAIEPGFERFAAYLADKWTLHCDAKCRSLYINGWSETGQSMASCSSTEHRIAVNGRSVWSQWSVRYVTMERPLKPNGTLRYMLTDRSITAHPVFSPIVLPICLSVLWKFVASKGRDCEFSKITPLLI